MQRHNSITIMTPARLVVLKAHHRASRSCRSKTRTFSSPSIVIAVEKMYTSNNEVFALQYCNFPTIFHKQNTHMMQHSLPHLLLYIHKLSNLDQIHCLDVILEDLDVARAITEYVSYAGIELLVLGASQRHGFIRWHLLPPMILPFSNFPPASRATHYE